MKNYSLTILNFALSIVILSTAPGLFAQDKTPEEKMIAAFEVEEFETAMALVKDVSSPDYSDRYKYSLLMYASAFNSPEMVKILLEKGANPDLQNMGGGTALIQASISGHSKIVQLLIDEGADVNVQDSDGMTALMNAVHKGNKEVVKILLDNGADVGLKAKEGYSAMRIARDPSIRSMLLNAQSSVLRKADSNEAKLMSAMKAKDSPRSIDLVKNIEFVDYLDEESGYSLLMSAVENDYPEVVEVLLEKRANPNLVTKGGTALTTAVRFGHFNMLKLLIENGANINTQTREGFTALILAAQTGYPEIVAYLLEKGANTDIQAGENTAEKAAKQAGNEEIVKMLENHEIATVIPAVRLLKALKARNHENASLIVQSVESANYVDKSGFTNLMYAVSLGYTDVVVVLLEKGAKVDYKTSFGHSAPGIARQSNKDEIYYILINSLSPEQKLILAIKGNDMETAASLMPDIDSVDYADTDGNTALMLASATGQPALVKLLLSMDAEIDIQNKRGWSALIFATYNNRPETVKILLEYKAKTELLDKNGHSALMLSHKSSIEVVNLLLDNGAIINYQNNYGETALMLISSSGNIELVKLLMDRGANTRLRNRWGETAYKVAQDADHTEIAELLSAASQ